MKCPFRKKREVSHWNDGLVKKSKIEEYFMECIKDECPYYRSNQARIVTEWCTHPAIER